MSIAPFPHTYSVSFDAGQLAAAAVAPIPAGAPAQFGGSDDVWSPEHLLVAAALLCLKTTFDAYARREKLAIHAWHGRGNGVLVKGAEGAVFSSIDLDVDIETDPGQEARTEAVLATAERNCIISRALNAPVHVRGNVSAASTRVAG